MQPGVEDQTTGDHPPTAHIDPHRSRVGTDGGHVTVYWRPGCPFCSSLRRGLRRAGLPFQEVNIWDDPSGAAFVRSVARGNETVPTVAIGSVNLVNPSARRVLEVAASQSAAPTPSPAQGPRRRRWKFGKYA